jgi:L-amino acid N-acyltransferase YncA
VKSRLKNFANAVVRFLLSFQRPSKAANMRLLRQRGQSLDSFRIREATAADIPALAELHVKTWSETYFLVKNAPTYQVREPQWRQQFEITDGTWFCLVVENDRGELIGFAKGKTYKSRDLPGYFGELNKVYLLREYQRLGLGRRLLAQVAARFRSMDINSMVLFGVPQNPSCAFHEALGGKKLYASNGEFHGGYGWRNLEPLASGAGMTNQLA